MNRRFEFQKRSQLFIRVHDESLSVVAMLHPQHTVLTSLTRFAIKAHLIRGAFYLLLLLTVCVIAFAVGQRLIGAPSPKDNPAGFFVLAVLSPEAGARERTCQVLGFAWSAFS